MAHWIIKKYRLLPNLLFELPLEYYILYRMKGRVQTLYWCQVENRKALWMNMLVYYLCQWFIWYSANQMCFIFWWHVFNGSWRYYENFGFKSGNFINRSKLWFKYNKLTVNKYKTDKMIFGLCTIFKKSVKLLGMHLDSRFAL